MRKFFIKKKQKKESRTKLVLATLHNPNRLPLHCAWYQNSYSGLFLDGTVTLFTKSALQPQQRTNISGPGARH